MPSASPAIQWVNYAYVVFTTTAGVALWLT